VTPNIQRLNQRIRRYLVSSVVLTTVATMALARHIAVLGGRAGAFSAVLV
jgi:hypothetical protein